MDILKDIEEDLGKGEDGHLCIEEVHIAQQAGQIAWDLQIRYNRNQNTVENRLGRIKDAIKL